MRGLTGLVRPSKSKTGFRDLDDRRFARVGAQTGSLLPGRPGRSGRSGRSGPSDSRDIETNFSVSGSSAPRACSPEPIALLTTVSFSCPWSRGVGQRRHIHGGVSSFDSMTGTGHAAIGCVGVRLLAADALACEMKRLYVRPEARKAAAPGGRWRTHPLMPLVRWDTSA